MNNLYKHPKAAIIFAVALVAVLSLVCILSILAADNFMKDVYALSPQTAEELLGKHIPEVILENMPGFRELDLESGDTLWLWYLCDDESLLVHYVEFVLNDGVLRQYGYKNYDFHGIPENNITVEQAFDLAEEFALAFTPGGELLDFKNKPDYSSRYEPGKAESFVAERGGVKYIIVVNLRHGFVEFFLKESQ